MWCDTRCEILFSNMLTIIFTRTGNPDTLVGELPSGMTAVITESMSLIIGIVSVIVSIPFLKGVWNICGWLLHPCRC